MNVAVDFVQSVYLRDSREPGKTLATCTVVNPAKRPQQHAEDPNFTRKRHQSDIGSDAVREKSRISPRHEAGPWEGGGAKHECSDGCCSVRRPTPTHSVPWNFATHVMVLQVSTQSIIFAACCRC